MYCSNCGNQLVANARFCSKCGKEVEYIPDISQPSFSDKNVVPSPSPSGPLYQKATTDGVPPYQTPPPAGMVPQPPKIQPRKSGSFSIKKTLQFVIPAAVVIVGVTLTALFFPGFGKASKQNAVFYLSDNKYMAILDAGKTKIEPVTMGNAKPETDYEYENMAVISPGGKYVYCMTKFNGYSGNLQRILYNKLTDNTTKNDKYVENIASNVGSDFQFIDDEQIVYLDQNATLYYFDGKESHKIKKDVSGFQTDKNGNIIFYRGSYWDGYDIYGTSTHAISEIQDLAKGAEGLIDISDPTNIIYLDNSSDQYEFVQTGVGNLSKPLLENQEDVEQINDVWYSVVDSTTFLDLYLFVEDNEDPAFEEMRKELQSEDNYFPLRELHAVKDGESILLADNIVDINAEEDENLMVMFTSDLLSNLTYSIDELESIYEIAYDISDLNSYDGAYVCTFDHPEQIFCVKSSDWDDFPEGDVYYLVGDKLIAEAYSDEWIMAATITDGVLGEWETIAEDASILRIEDSKLYYVKDMYSGNGDFSGYYGDIYFYDTMGNNTCIMRDVLPYTCKVYEDGSILGYTDYSNGAYELTEITSKGERRIISDEVTTFFKTDSSTIMYVSDQDLYKADAKGSLLIESEIDYLWPIGEMNVTTFHPYMVYGPQE